MNQRNPNCFCQEGISNIIILYNQTLKKIPFLCLPRFFMLTILTILFSAFLLVPPFWSEQSACAALRSCRQNVVSTKIIEKLAAHKIPFCAHKIPFCAHKSPTTSLGYFSKTSTLERFTNFSMKSYFGLLKLKEKNLVLPKVFGGDNVDQNPRQFHIGTSEVSKLP